MISIHIVMASFVDIKNSQVAQAALLDDDTSTCMTLKRPTLHKEFEWVEMEMPFHGFLDVFVSGRRFICQRTLCDTMLPVLLYHQEISTVHCSTGSETCIRYKLCKLLSEVQSTIDGLVQCNYRCTCGHPKENNCHNLLFMFDRKMNDLHMLPVEICDIRANTVP